MLLLKCRQYAEQANYYYQRLLERLPINQQQLIVIAIALSLIFLLMLIPAMRFAAPETSGETVVDLNKIRFSLFDAEELCSAKLVDQLGEQLLRYHVDDHSSRLDTDRGVYRVYMKADIGEKGLYDEVSVHCFVDQWDQELDHFRQYNPNIRPVVSAELKFFK